MHTDGEGPPMLFAHGFGCDQNMWRFVAPAFTKAHRVVLFDHVGADGDRLDVLGADDVGKRQRDSAPPQYASDEAFHHGTISAGRRSKLQTSEICLHLAQPALR